MTNTSHFLSSAAAIRSERSRIPVQRLTIMVCEYGSVISFAPALRSPSMIDLPSIARNLHWNTEGFWDCPSPGGDISYPAQGNQTCFAIEDGSLWFGHRNA